MLKNSTILENYHDEEFDFPDLPVLQACGYSFCEKSQTSTYAPSQKNCEKEDDSLKNQQNYYKQLQLTYEEHKIDEAFKYAQLYEKQSQEKKRILSNSEKELIKRIKMEMQDVQYFEKKVHQSGWKVQKEKKNITVSTKYEGETVGVLVEAHIDVQIEKFLTVMIETDLMKKFMPFMVKSNCEKKLGRNNRIGYAVNDFPILSYRQAFFQGIGYDRMNYNKTIMIFSRTLHNRPDLQELFGYQVIPTPGSIQLDYHYFVLEYRPLSPNQGTIKLAINTDLKLSLPMFILSAASEGFGMDFYLNLLKISKKFQGSEWQEKVKEDPQFFEFVQRRIKEYFHES